MFIGSILTHLGKAKQQLESDSNKRKSQETIASKVIETNKSQFDELREKQIAEVEAKKQDLLGKQAEIENKITRVEHQLVVTKYIFIRFRPPKSMNI